MVSLQAQRIMDCLINSDPDELVDLLRVSSWELIMAFPDRVEDYILRESHVEDSEEEDVY